MIQNNLRDIDAGMDVDRYIDYLKEFGADVCMVGCGGITAFYPTELDFQKTSPYLTDDFFGNLLQKCHDNGIRVIARFDFSKTHIEFANVHPEWYSRSLSGELVCFHDTAATCVNGGYQQNGSLQILEEVLTHYPVDGVFFNMFGYQTRDYDNHYVGICQCENCRKRFYQYSHMELPREENEEDPVFQKYKEFQKFTTEELLEKIYHKVKQLNPEAAVCTYSNHWVDLVRSESNSAVDRPLPFWLMASEENAGCVRGSLSECHSSNCVINAVDIFYRFMGVSPWLNALRLYGNLATGENLDWCMIGGFETYPDRKNFELVKKIFQFHRKYERYLNHLQSCARILLIRPSGQGNSARNEYRGIFKMLKESHLLFDLLDLQEMEQAKVQTGRYSVVLLPGVQKLGISVAENLRNCGAVLVATGAALREEPDFLSQMFGVTIGGRLSPIRGCYMLTEPKEVFGDFKDRDWVYLDKDYYFMEPEEENKNYLPLIRAGMYGPPERCQGYEITDQSYVSVREGRAVYFSWMPGSLYQMQGYEDFKQIFLDVLRKNTDGMNQMLRVDGPPCAEVFFDRCGPDLYLLQVINYSGFNGTTFFEPLDVELEIRVEKICVEKVQILTESGRKKLTDQGHFHLKVRGLYQAALIYGKERL